MALINWTEEFNIGIDSIDVQHKHLVDIVNKFDEAMRKGKDSPVMNGIFNDLVGYTQEHFADEETIMAAAEYADLKQHQAEHRQLLQKVEQFQFDFGQESRDDSGHIREFLKNWLTSHILNDDKVFVETTYQRTVGS